MHGRGSMLIAAIFSVGILSTSRLGALPGVSVDGASRQQSASYRVLKPIKSGDLTIFPVTPANQGSKGNGWRYITLDEGLKSGEVVVTEAGRAQGLFRPRQHTDWYPSRSGDQVNELVLVNHSPVPLILLAGEIVTGGKQDRVIAKDRIIPPQGDPIDLSVFCIEPGRWVQSSERFGAAGKARSSFMVQPAVRQEAMVAKDQQKVWGAVGGVIQGLGEARSSSPGSRATTSYAKTMQDDAVARRVDQAGGTLPQQREEILTKLRQENAVGVIAAVRGEIVWADIFADSNLLAKYWTKLVRSYAAEAATSREQKDPPATQEDAQRFLGQVASGRETSDGEVGVYRYSEMHSGNTVSFILRALLRGTNFDVHISKTRMNAQDKNEPALGKHLQIQ